MWIITLLPGCGSISGLAGFVVGHGRVAKTRRLVTCSRVKMIWMHIGRADGDMAGRPARHVAPYPDLTSFPLP